MRLRFRYFVFLVPAIGSCDAFNAPVLSLDGDWQIVFSATQLPTCITITNDYVTSLLSDCVTPQPVLSAAPVLISGSSVAFGYTLGGTRVTSSGLLFLEIEYEYAGSIQADGSISALRTITVTLNGQVLEVLNDAVVMSRR